MLSWLLLALALIFAYLAYDAFSLAAPALPQSETAKGMGQDLSYLSLAEQEKLGRYPNRYRLGDPNQTVWVFAILAIGFALATVLAFSG